jgi:hypothetical protein
MRKSRFSEEQIVGVLKERKIAIARAETRDRRGEISQGIASRPMRSMPLCLRYWDERSAIWR